MRKLNKIFVWSSFLMIVLCAWLAWENHIDICRRSSTINGLIISLTEVDGNDVQVYSEIQNLNGLLSKDYEAFRFGLFGCMFGMFTYFQLLRWNDQEKKVDK